MPMEGVAELADPRTGSRKRKFDREEGVAVKSTSKEDMRESVKAPQGLEVECKAEDECEQITLLTRREREVYWLLASRTKKLRTPWALRSALLALMWKTCCANWASRAALK